MDRYALRKGKESDLPQIAALLVNSWQENYASFLPPEFLDKMDISKQIERHRNYIQGNAMYFVALEADKLMGFSSFGLNRDNLLPAKWELYTLYVDTKYHRKGIGHALLKNVCQKIPDTKRGLAVWVMEKNPFRSFYKKQGFIQQKKTSFDFGGFEVPHVGYVKTG